MTSRGTRAIDELRRRGVAHVVRAYDLPERHGGPRADRPRYGLDAAAALGLPPDRIGKTLVAAVDDTLVLAVIPVDAELDFKALAAAVGGRRAVLAEPAAAERATGYVLGGISPIATNRRLATIVDASIAGQHAIHVSAGRRGLQMELAPADLVRVTAARVAAIARRP